MAICQPSKIFVTLPNASPILKKKQDLLRQYYDLDQSDFKPAVVLNQKIRLCATGELVLVPDRCKVIFVISSRKEKIQDVKNSVQRRLDYIIQTLRNQQIKEGDITINKILQRGDGDYRMDTEIIVQFVDFTKCQSIQNTIAEKLDNVRATLPEFFHSPQRLENVRRQCCFLAIKNAKVKAAELAKYLRVRVGNVIEVDEEHCKEWEGLHEMVISQDANVSPSIHEKLDQATIHVQVKVHVTFEMKPKRRLKGEDR